MKKLSLYILIMIVVTGVFGIGISVNAQSPDGKGTCYNPNVIFPEPPKATTLNEEQCKANSGTLTEKPYNWVPAGATKPNCVYDSNGTPKNLPCTPDAEHTPVKCDPPLVAKDNKCVPGETPPDPRYILLAPLPCEKGSSEGCVQNADGSYTLNNFDPTQADGSGIGKYLNIMIRIFIGICAVLAVVMIVVGGLEWMTSGLASSKEAGKERIWGAVMGLLLALGSWILLETINPNLLKTDLKSLKDVTVEVNIDEGVPAKAGSPSPSGDLTAWARQYGQVLKMTLKDGTVIDLKPCDGANIVNFRAFGTSFQLNKYLYGSISRLHNKWQTSYKSYPMASAGGYVCKVILGKDGKPTGNVSYHSYGLAIDFNSAKNGRGTKGDMPAGLVSEWKKEGWSWGGDWGWTDPMHFGMGEGGGTIKGEK